jgi:hypothetical protein
MAHKHVIISLTNIFIVNKKKLLTCLDNHLKHTFDIFSNAVCVVAFDAIYFGSLSIVSKICIFSTNSLSSTSNVAECRKCLEISLAYIKFRQ